MVGLACISKCVVCEKREKNREGMAEQLMRRRVGRIEGRKRQSRNLACTSINLHLLVRDLPRPWRSLVQGAPARLGALHQRRTHSCLERFKIHDDFLIGRGIIPRLGQLLIPAVANSLDGIAWL